MPHGGSRPTVPGRPLAGAARGRPRLVDVALAAFTVAVMLQAQVAPPLGVPVWLSGVTPAAVALLAVQLLPYAWRVSAPVVVLALTALPSVLVLLIVQDVPDAQRVAHLAWASMVYTVAAYRPPRLSLCALAVCEVLFVVVDREVGPHTLVQVAVDAVPWVIGFAVGRRRLGREQELQTFEVNRRQVDDVLLVEDELIVSALRLLFERLKLVVEPSGASAFAAVLAHPEAFAGRSVGVILSGGNVGADRFATLVAGAQGTSV